MKVTIARLLAWAVIVRASWMLLDTIVNTPIYPLIYVHMLVLAVVITFGGVTLFGIRDKDSYGLVPIIIVLILTQLVF